MWSNYVHLLTDVRPFGGSNNQSIIKKILISEYDKIRLANTWKPCIDLINKLLTKDIKKRYADDSIQYNFEFIEDKIQLILPIFLSLYLKKPEPDTVYNFNKYMLSQYSKIN